MLLVLGVCCAAPGHVAADELRGSVDVVDGDTLAVAGEKVRLLDADPNQALTSWARHATRPGRLAVETATDDERIIDLIEGSAADFTLVDLEGTASKLVAFALSRADRAIIPMQPSSLDAFHAGRTVALIRQQEKAFRIRLPAKVLLTRISVAIRPTSLREVTDSMDKHGIARFRTELVERDAFRRVFSAAATLEELNGVPAAPLQAARANVAALAEEVLAWQG